MQYYSNLVACSRFDFCNQDVSRAWDRGGWQMRLPNYVSGRWCAGLGSGELLVDPVTGDELVSISSEGIDLEAGLQFARAHGGPALRELTYTQRADLLAKIAEALAANRDEYFRLSLVNLGATPADRSEEHTSELQSHV